MPPSASRSVATPMPMMPDMASQASAVSWPAIAGGAVAAIGTTLILLALGGGIGLTTVSPWAGLGASAATLGVAALVWIVLVQWIASAIGGYIAGRLRTRWAGVQADEVFFRDTAHGFLAWCVATLVGTALLASATGSVIAGTTKAVTAVATAGAAGAAQAGAQQASGVLGLDYVVDTLLRGDTPPAATATPAPRAEIGRTLTHAATTGALSPEDKAYLAKAVSAQTGLNQAEAEQRVDRVVAQVKATEQEARAAADAARKRAAQISIVTALSMVIGAFIASVCGALGGRLRDE